ncbi:hypothetical protein [Mesorhizobium sp.]|nr:hypothetical protein [Mesorhizobium sp.]
MTKRQHATMWWRKAYGETTWRLSIEQPTEELLRRFEYRVAVP